jgi:DNA polymerase-3 subunit delta'
MNAEGNTGIYLTSSFEIRCSTFMEFVESDYLSGGVVPKARELFGSMTVKRAVIPFSQIIGQDKAIHLLKQTIKREKMPHAYLFVGAPGVGKTTTALAMAQALNCEEPQDGESCGRCRSCRQLLGGNFPDFELLEPDGQSIKIEQVRELERRFGYRPVAGRYRVTVVRPAEAMTEEASNAFLKTLEEPPSGNVLVLNATEPSNLLPTIVSRCQKVVFRRIPLHLAEEWLMARQGMDREKATVLARISDGSLGRALELEESGFLEKRQEALLWLTQLQGMALEDAVDWASRFEKKLDKEERQRAMAALVGLWKAWYRDLLLIKAEGPEESLINRDLSRELKIAAEAFRMEHLVFRVQALDQAERDLLRYRNQELVLENAVLQLKQNEPERSLS